MASKKQANKATPVLTKPTCSSNTYESNNFRSPPLMDNDLKRTRTNSTTNQNSQNQRNKAPSSLRKYNILYSENAKPPFQAILESRTEENPISKNTSRLLMEFLNKKLDFDGGECLNRKNDRQYILEFKCAENANKFVTNVDITPIREIAYIPPSYVEITGIIRGVPTQYSDEELRHI
jgi:hypothetical protein